MRSLTIFSVLTLGGPALGAPNAGNALEIRSVNECKAVTVIIDILSQYKASATSFCSSFISIPLKTVTWTNVLMSLLEDMDEVLNLVDYNIDAKPRNRDTGNGYYSNDVC